MAGILVANTAFSCESGGQYYSIAKGMTVREGHPVLNGHELYFKPLVVDMEFEPAAKRSAATPKRTPRAGD